jgi:hypothetical protein
MKVGNDPSCWRFANVHEALGASTTLLAQLIRAGMEAAQTETTDDEGEEVETPPLLSRAQ